MAFAMIRLGFLEFCHHQLWRDLVSWLLWD